jgi:hypothetical protein
LIFSDEPDWVKNNLKLAQPTKFAADYQLTDNQELILMSRCAHQIISNSSFGWWGAWLNTKADKIVVAPTKLVNDKELENNNIIFDGWIRL